MKSDQDKLKDNSRASRGYCGYFTTSKNKKLYLRSTKEFIVATWLSSLETENITLLGEWYFGDYRPDFRILINNKLRFVFEVKDNKNDAVLYMQKYQKLFLNMGVHYIVIYSNRHFKKLVDKFSIDENIWKNSSVYDYSGKNNPAFGRKHSIESLIKIGDATRKRNLDPKYVEMVRDKQKQSFTQDVRNKISENTKKYAKLRREEKDREDPIIEVACVYCNTKKKLRTSKVKELTFCDARCASPYYKIIGKSRKFTDKEKFDRMKKTLLAYANKVFSHYGQNIDTELIRLAKSDKLIPPHAQLSEASITKYFDGYEQLNLEITKGKNG